MKTVTIFIILIIVFYLSLTGSRAQSHPLDGKPEKNYTSAFTEEELMYFLDQKDKMAEMEISKGIAVIPFELESECYVTVKIFDRNGNFYETLVDGFMHPGKYSVIFKPGLDRIPEEFEFRIEESGKLIAHSFLIKK